MNRLKNLFTGRTTPVLNVYCTAGFPYLDSTLPVMKALAENGADIIELGMPYSDPLADGPVIQSSGMQALHNGMSISVLFEQLQNMRAVLPSHLPVVLMGYLNPVLQYGFQKFCTDARAAGIDALIIPDIPSAVYKRDYQKLVSEAGLDFIFLVTPETSAERVKELDALSSGFIYAVSSSSLTGSAQDFNRSADYLKHLAAMNLQNPILVGFGIKDRVSYLQATENTAGGIIGSAFIQALQADPDHISQATTSFLNKILS